MSASRRAGHGFRGYYKVAQGRGTRSVGNMELGTIYSEVDRPGEADAAYHKGHRPSDPAK